MILSDRDIKRELYWKKLVIEPLDFEDVQPASVDVHLAAQFKELTSKYIDPTKRDLVQVRGFSVVEGSAYVLAPGKFVLASTVERVEIPNYMVSRIEGKSSLGRLGLAVHSTAGFIDPGFKGMLTLEVSNNSGATIYLWPSMKIGQLSFEYLHSPAVRPYGSAGLGSHYQGQEGPTL